MEGSRALEMQTACTWHLHMLSFGVCLKRVPPMSNVHSGAFKAFCRFTGYEGYIETPSHKICICLCLFCYVFEVRYSLSNLSLTDFRLNAACLMVSASHISAFGVVV